MSIEIRQLTIKSTILAPRATKGPDRRRSDAELKSEVLAQCRRMIAEAMGRDKER